MTPKFRPVYFFVSLAIGVSGLACQPDRKADPEPAPATKNLPYGEKDEKDDPFPNQNGDQSPETLAEFDKVDGAPIGLKISCAAQICGDPAKAETPGNLLRAPLETLPNETRVFDDRFRPLIDRHIAVKVESHKLGVDVMEKARERLAKVKLSAEETALINVIWTIANYNKAMRALKQAPGADKKWILDDAALQKEMPGYSAAELEHFKVYFFDLFQAQEIGLSAMIDQLPLKIALKEFYKDLSFEEARKTLVSQLRESIGVLKRTFPGLIFPELPSLDVLEQGKDLGPDLVDNLSTAVFYRYIHRVVATKSEVFSARAIPVAESVEIFFTGGKFASLRADALDAAGIENARQSALKSCRWNIAKSSATAPSPDDIVKANSMIEVARAASVSALDEMKLEQGIHGKVMTAIGSLEFGFPLTRDEMLAGFERELKYKINETERDLAALPSLSDNALFMNLYSTLVSTLKPLKTVILASCKQYGPSQLTDHAITAYGRIGVSWQTVRFPKHGIGIVAHEFGHVISSALKDKKNGNEPPVSYQSLKHCTTIRHGSDTEIDTSEEDFADWVSARAMHYARAQSVAFENVGCILAGNNAERWGTRTGLSLRYSSEFNKFYRDPHSPNFYRLLQVQLNSGAAMPKECSEVIDLHMPSAKVRCEARN